MHGPVDTPEDPSAGQTGAPTRRLPPWLRRNPPPSGAHRFTSRVLDQLALETVCDHARCPNRMECYSQKTATFMILGNVCTRGCPFCAVTSGVPGAVDDDEPRRLGEAAKRLGLAHVVMTSVTRDDLPDGGAEHFCRCVEAVRSQSDATVEVLIPDFAGSTDALSRVLDASPDVLNHNVETVPRLYPTVRSPNSNYRGTLDLFRQVRRIRPSVKTKTGMMLGLGETYEELLDVWADLLDAGCDLLTLGQYLQPRKDCLPVAEYVPPAEFDTLGQTARSLGFLRVASGPLVRSSYHAREMVQGV